VTRPQVIALLNDSNAKLPPGGSLFIYLPVGGSSLVIRPTLPATHGNPATVPEGSVVSPGQGSCASDPDTMIKFRTVDSSIDFANTNNVKGDTGIHERPYMKDYGGDFQSTDRCDWRPSCGGGAKKNLLGELEFVNETSGEGEFCKPN